MLLHRVVRSKGASGSVSQGIRFLNGQPWKNQFAHNAVQNGRTGTWSLAGSAPADMVGGTTLMTKNVIYVLGCDGGKKVVKVPVNIDGTLGTMDYDTDLPVSLAQSSVILTKDRVYMLGGNDEATGTVATILSAPVDAEGLIGTWSVVGSLPGPLRYSQAVVTRNRVYMLGGFDGNGAVTGVVYTAPINTDGTLGEWVVSTNSLPAPISQSQAITTNNRVYLIGGLNTGSSRILTAQFNEEGVLGNWFDAPALPAPRGRHQVAVTKYRVFLFGGYGNGGHQRTVFSAPLDSDGMIGTWEGSDTDNPLSSIQSDCAGAVVTNSKLYLFGGSYVWSKVYATSFVGGSNNYLTNTFTE